MYKLRVLVNWIIRQFSYRSRRLIALVADYAELLLFPPPAVPQGGNIRRRWSGGVALDGAARVAVFMHFARDDTVAPYVRYYVRKLREAGFAVVFASNTPDLSDETIAPLLPDVALAFTRENVGWDFAAYRDAIALIPDVPSREMLLITNDSVFGPLYDLPPLIAKADPREADVWGSTDSWERHYHLQSFFLLFHQKALRNKAFQEFWRGVRHFRRKHWIIEKYEIGLTRTLQSHGLRCKALFPYDSVTAAFMRGAGLPPAKAEIGGDRAERELDNYIRMLARRIREATPINQTHFFWYELTVSMGFPFIKRELLQKNPAKIPNIAGWERVISSVSTYDPALIHEHLANQ
ncbi:MAG: rhamnan synthesis F family protein [Azospirillaceae bacterium]|nr:rhamnan synthesis F family protein [Azospirillaceae bacterium]